MSVLNLKKNVFLLSINPIFYMSEREHIISSFKISVVSLKKKNMPVMVQMLPENFFFVCIYRCVSVWMRIFVCVCAGCTYVDTPSTEPSYLWVHCIL